MKRKCSNSEKHRKNVLYYQIDRVGIYFSYHIKRLMNKEDHFITSFDLDNGHIPGMMQTHNISSLPFNNTLIRMFQPSEKNF